MRELALNNLGAVAGVEGGGLQDPPSLPSSNEDLDADLWVFLFTLAFLLLVRI